MPDDQDRVLAQLAVEAGFLTREEASHYWQRLHAYGAPRLVQLLTQEGRLSPPQVEQLRMRYMSMRQLANAVVPASPAIIDDDVAGDPGATALSPTAIEDASTVLDGPPAPPPRGGAAADGWEESLQKDALLARALLERGLTTLARLRECRQLQIQHRLRLGVVLVKMGYVDRANVEQAITSILSQLGGMPARSAQTYQAAETQLDGPGGRRAQIPAQDDQGTVLEGPMDNVDTVLNSPAVAPLRKEPQFDPFSTAATGRSVEELNPFALAEMGKLNQRPTRSDDDIPLPDQHRPPVPSVDELDAFTDVPLPPPPSPGAAYPDPAQDMRHGLPPAPPSGSRNSGFTPTGVPVGGEIETGSTRLKAREKASLLRTSARKQRTKKKGSNFSLLVILMLVGGLVIAGGLYALIAYMPF